MNTPIWDFLKKYAESGAVRLHMPGHKGEAPFDVTEIDGADVLYKASGIIAESEKNASVLFGSARTFYSAEGSSLCIRAMVHLISLYAKEKGKTPYVLAYRNVHKSFVDAVALTDTDVDFIYPENSDIMSADVSLQALEELIKEKTPTALYITSPSYLGEIADITGAAKICKKYGVLLAVDNAHGAYTKFLCPSEHPLDMGADIVCDSAHKTLPVLTGGAYLHVGKNAPSYLAENAENALSLFASTSPSYLILSSLDRVNQILAEDFRGKLFECVKRVEELKAKLSGHGFETFGDEKLKLTLMPKTFGYLGTELAKILSEKGIFCEFADRDYLVAMLSPYNTENDFKRLEDALLSIERKAPIEQKAPCVVKSKRALSIRKARLSPYEKTDAEKAEGKILASALESCPPAIPVMICGEVITKESIDAFRYYGINEILTVKE